MGQEYHIHGAHKFSVICGFFRGICVCVCVCVCLSLSPYICTHRVFFWGSKFCAFFQPQNCNFYTYIEGFFVWVGGEMDLIHQISNKVEIKLPDFYNQKLE
jgi:hypothetical protein